MGERASGNLLYDRAIGFGCVDLRIHPNRRISGYYATPGGSAKRKRIIDMRGYPLDLRTEFMTALESCWKEGTSDDRCHKLTLGVIACVEALSGFEGETFVDMPAEAVPEKILSNDACRHAINLLRNPLKLREASGGDVWRTEELQIPPERINPARPIHYIDFSKIENEENKSLIKEYVSYRIRETAVQLSTIYEAFLKIKEFEAFLQGMPLSEVGHRELEGFERGCLAKTTVKHTSTKMFAVKGFYTWLHQAGVVFANPFSGYEIARDGSRDLKVTAPSDEVIARIGEVLPSLPLDEELQFLILKCTGMRISELCLLERDCLERTATGGCFLRFWCQKMSKDVQNVIPPSLYSMIEEYIGLLPPKQKYLFVSAKDSGRPVPCTSVVSRLNRSFAAAGVKNADGSDYGFAPHSMRHKMAVQLAEIDAPLSIIQEQLHHASREMTVSYTEFDMKKRTSKAAKFIDSNGIEAPCFVSTAKDVVESKVDWMKERLDAQILPNGVCGRPVALGECKKCNACLECPDFRTSIEFIDVHRDQLQRTRHFISAAKAAGWTHQLASAERLAEKLERIIEKLER